ncbi:terminase ATPase subunit family protein [Ralstonia pseudosolanacearum]|uniref:terminase ATPase subunit family protein n=1 Tax=Ralstonia pseudosolanacearum TaxID=1310165 RepID=UPI0007D7C757|nr:terminase ATPase subunit family protein [Ralstonia pseudosolanacearum]MDC6293973.1 terminase ATPase subunit family protein [Ralstonia pseudosolanacearum]MDD7788870.1 terminase ATPase subunit family protein [Ralstonia pseudosolanacearum]MDN3370099.1 terminase ATPase subunit family protein [Ralstonia pseudosolanacearum]OAK90924.1 oxidoreductase [Ralstonia pseudosolanacearum]QOK87727.1 terminase ATPase subunit family protein [Ralstonia pseudosolanacearum]
MTTLPPLASLSIDPERDPRRVARTLYWQGYRVARIAEMLGVKAVTVHSWKRRDGWDATDAVDRVAASIEERMARLVAKEVKEGRDYKEIDLLGRQMERIARVRRYEASGNEADLNPKVANRNQGPRKKPERNAISDDQEKQLVDAFHDAMFGYQRVWYEAGQVERIRNLLKSRQIGATWYFAREAFIDALTTGRNQIFLSASKAQAHVFKQYIVQFAKDAAGVELKGDPMVLPNGATLYFLGTNARTAQSYHGNLYFDEYFWVPRFQELRKVASGMAIHKHWRQTYFSTPSSLAHEAYPFWSGALFNRGKSKDAQVKIDISHAALRDGLRCADGQWRQIVTVEDALRGGCNLFDLDQLRLEYSEPEFANLLMCAFIDDNASVFPLSMLMRGMVDSWEAWEDFRPFAPRPFGNRPVWVGYDPNGGGGDSAALVVVAPPLVPGGKFRVLEKHQFRGIDYEEQAAAIRRVTERYTVAYIGIDRTGIGDAVYQLVSKFRPDAEGFTYSVDVKTRLVLKAHDVISKGRLEFDTGWTDFAASFLSIKKTVTAAGGRVTYQAGRSEDTSHADLAWACMHALSHEPLEGATTTNTSILELS